MTKLKFSFNHIRSFNLILFILMCSFIVSCVSVNKIMTGKNDYLSIDGYSGIDESNYMKAITKLSKIIKRDSLNAEALNARGFCYLRLNSFSEALVDYNNSIQISPSVNKFINRSKTNMKLGNYQAAFNDLRNATELDSTNIYLDFNYGIFYLDVKNYEKAIQHFLKSIQKDETTRFIAYYNIGKCYRYLNNFEKAIENYNAARMINPNIAPLYDNIGTANMLLGNNEEGIKNYTKAIELDSNFYSPYYNRGNAYFNSGNFNNAISDYNKAITLTENPSKHIVINCNLSRLMFLTKNYGESINYGNKILLYKDKVDLGIYYYIALYNMAISNLKLSKPDIAYEIYKDCFEDGTISKNPELVEETCSDLIEHYKTGSDQMLIKNILLNIIKISEDDFNNRLVNN